MIDRWKIDLGEVRNDQAFPITELRYIYIGDCDGDVTIKLGSRSHSALNPEEFGKVTDVSNISWIYITNEAQAGKELVLYIEEKEGGWRLWK
jgi:hypothetical protein